jgi:predicted transcriptional regulator of viral defense system
METLNQTLIDCIRACGGSKQVAPIMWPEKDPESAVRLLLDCMNESAELMRQFIAATSIQADLVTRMEKAANRINQEATC